ncbi:hypothetical protein SISNIDRAFT_548857 [Sistotremastrum niveocremeum HHB9708]|uniref:F-box domain-containing protein n=1 Tax=Sistotremastrum niveocremeum HHB9708 TaxID=1314777 RepID=A0A164WCE7_9AGAM|nr:hypothetical protein SISNIDRAFT_548857 [Sistotremastrum niveocremeum HHB9708]
MDGPQASESCSQFWSTAELVAMSFEVLDKCSLAKCARVNKFLSKHALDAIYRYNPDFLSVLELLSPTSLKDNELMFNEVMNPSGWDRFRHYSSRIRAIDVKRFPNPLSQESMVDLITTVPGGTPLFPLMTDLRWRTINESTSPLVLFLLHDKLKNVIFSVTVDDLHHGILLGNLARRAPNLESLHFWVLSEDSEHADAAEGIIDAVEFLTSLRSLDVFTGMATPRLLQALSSHNHLQRFWASLYGPQELSVDNRVIESDAVAHHEFPCLSEVAICSSLFMAMSSKTLFDAPSLVSLHIDVDLEAHISSFLPHVSSTCTRLRHLSLRIDEDEETEITLTMEMLQPALKLKLIETFVVECTSPPLLDDHDISDFATAFPRLRHFELCPRAEGAPLAKSPTLAALIPFAVNCPELISIGIYMDASVPPPPLQLDDVRFSSHFEVMHVLCCRITDHRLVVNFLMSILPDHANLRLSRCSRHLRFVTGDNMEDFHPAPTSDEGLLPESIQYRKQWEAAIGLLDSLEWPRVALSKQRAEICRLTAQLNSIGA